MFGKKTIVRNEWSSNLSKIEIEGLIKLFENSLNFIIQSHNTNTYNNHERESLYIMCLIYFMISVSRDQDFCFMIFTDWYSNVKSRSCFHCKKNMFLFLIENDDLNEFGISINNNNATFNKFEGFSKVILKNDDLDSSDLKDLFSLLYNLVLIDLTENHIPPIILNGDEIHDLQFFKFYDKQLSDVFGRSYLMLYYHFQDLKRDQLSIKKRKYDYSNNNQFNGNINKGFDIEDMPPCLVKMKKSCEKEKRHPKDIERLFFISVLKDFCDEKMMLDISNEFEYDTRSNSRSDDIHALKNRIKAYFKNRSIANYGCSWAYENNICAFSDCNDKFQAMNKCHSTMDNTYMKPKDFVLRKLENKKPTY